VVVARLSLRARLGLSAAVVVAIVVGVTTLIEYRIVLNAVEAEAKDAAAATALGIAGELSERPATPTTADLDTMLFDFTRVEPALRSITVTGVAGERGSDVITTDEAPTPEALLLSGRALREQRPASSTDTAARRLHFVAVPLERDHRLAGTVVVAVSLESALAVRREIETTAFAFAALATLALAVALDHLARGLVFRPLGAIRRVMARASAGDLEARVEEARADEIGAVARGLNAMLARLGDFNAALRRDVEQATRELREANRHLADTAQRLFGARRDLARSERLAAAGRMAADVAHQVGTPLNLVSGYVQMLLAEQPAGSREGEKLRTVRDQIAKVTTIVQGLLDQARRPALDRRATSPAALLEGVAELARPTLAAANVELALEVPGDLPPIFVDAGQIEQALLNLVTNSRDAMPEGGRLWLSARGLDGFVELAVGDSGHGLPAEIVSQVFDPLFTTKPPGRGTGLGLPIVREVVAAHGGTVDFATRAGEGTTVTLRLPCAGPGVEHG
jgi:two-component system, NtrC family, sensor kinase